MPEMSVLLSTQLLAAASTASSQPAQFQQQHLTATAPYVLLLSLWRGSMRSKGIKIKTTPRTMPCKQCLANQCLAFSQTHLVKLPFYPTIYATPARNASRGWLRHCSSARGYKSDSHPLSACYLCLPDHDPSEIFFGTRAFTRDDDVGDMCLSDQDCPVTP